MTATESAKKALKQVREIMAECKDCEDIVIAAFLDEFCPEIEGWEMRREELAEID